MQDSTCDYCEFKGKNLRALNVHVGIIHKADGYTSITHLNGEAGRYEENNGKEAFKCSECKLLFILMCHMLGNKILSMKAAEDILG